MLQQQQAKLGASQVVLAVKNLPANAGDATDMGSISGLGRSPGCQQLRKSKGRVYFFKLLNFLK